MLLVRQIRGVKDQNPNPVIEIFTYLNHFSPLKFNKNFVDITEKKHSSIDKLLLFFQNILSQNWGKATFDNRKKFIKFLNVTIKEDSGTINNTSPITWENEELYIFNLYKEFLEQIKKKITHYESKNIDDDVESEKIKSCKEFIEKMTNELNKPNITIKMINKIKENIKKAKDNLKLYSFIEGDFFNEYLSKFFLFLSSIKETYLKELSISKFNTKEEQYIFEYFMIFISNYNFENITQAICDVWKYSFQSYESDLKLKLTEEYKHKNNPMILTFDNNSLIINAEEFKQIEIKNIEHYEIINLLINIYQNKKFKEYKSIDYVKIHNINEHLYIKKINEKWISFNLILFNSNTIKSMYQTLLKEQNILILNETELTVILKNIILYTFKTDFVGITMRSSLKIYEYNNYSESIQASNNNESNEDVFKLMTLAFTQITNFHEILGHLNIGYQIYSFEDEDKKKNFESPEVNKELSSEYAKKRGNKESGEDIEIKLFGRVITYLTLKEALFLLNPKNYIEKDYNIFREKFKKCNDSDLYIDETFRNLLISFFGINPDNIRKCKNIKFKLEDSTKKSNDISIFSIKAKHPTDYNIDGCKKEDFSDILKFLKKIINLREIGTRRFYMR